MADTPHETRADILAEMRDRAITKIGGRTITERNFVPQEVVEDWADRIEEAAEREAIRRDKVSFRCGDCANFGGDCDAGDVDGNEDCIACEKFRRRASPGNAAAMREALEELMKFTCNSCNERYCEEDVEEEDGTRYCSPCSAIIQARDALAAPARNCDRYADEDDAFAAWHAALNDGDVVSVRNAFAWLFAKAEGGEK